LIHVLIIGLVITIGCCVPFSISGETVINNKTTTIVDEDKELPKNDVEKFIISFEGLKTYTYDCQADRLSIGYGTKARSDNDVVTEREAHLRMREYLETITYPKLKGYKLTEKQKIAFSSFDYNSGEGQLLLDKKTKTINCENFKREVYNGGIFKKNTAKGKYIKQLEKRRQTEYNLCNSKD
jgi:GH24 family phage-related lysozyme (muramidase)